LHDETVRGVTKAGTTVAFQIRRIKAQRTHSWDEIIWEFGCAMARNDLRQNFLLHKTQGTIPRCAFFIREKLFDAIEIQRDWRHVVSVSIMIDSLAAARAENNAAGRANAGLNALGTSASKITWSLAGLPLSRL
jgi:hypothetical protein